MRAPKPRAFAAASAGPLLIVATVVIVLHDYLFGGRFSNINPDVQSVFLLNHCFLGTALQNGAIPAWNPFTMAGTPFVAGLGLYWFLRGEEISRAASTSAGLVMAMAIAGSKVLVNLPFSDTLAW